MEDESALRSWTPERAWVAALLAWACLSGVDAAAAPVDCPASSGTSTCFLTVGDSQVLVGATDDGNLLLVDSWRVGGVEQLYYQGFTVRLFTDFGPPSVLLEEASLDAETGTIVVSYFESASGLRTSVTFVVSDAPGISQIEETVVVESLSASVPMRLYVVNDFDLAGSRSDELGVSSTDGASFVQSDAGTEAHVEVLSPVASAFQVDDSFLLNTIIEFDQTHVLDGTTQIQGPADIRHALSWDRTLGPGQSLTAALVKTITVPEPEGPLGALAAGIGLALARRRAWTA
jgi:hypothetical protein